VFGHPGASGCYLAVDPAAERIVAVMTNTHLRTDRDAWYPRLLALAQGAWELADQA
jgi:hypothetical protein